MADRDDDFLSRWSRLKVEARHGLRKVEDLAPPAAEAPAAPAGSPEPPAAEGGEAAADVEALPVEEEFDEAEIEALDYGSDFTRFLKAGVPAAIKQKALRKLWASNPVFGRHDGLDDYYVTADFTDQARAVPGVASSWRPGKGYKTDEQLAAEADAEAKARAEAEGDKTGRRETAETQAPDDADASGTGGADADGGGPVPEADARLAENAPDDDGGTASIDGGDRDGPVSPQDRPSGHGRG